MKTTKSICLLFVFICTILNTTQVNCQAQFRVISCVGHAEHMNEQDSVLHPIIPGNKLVPRGKLIINDNCSVKLISNDKPFVIDQAGEYDLQELYQGSISQSMSFTGKFWNFVMEGLKKSDSKQDIKSYHQSYLAISGGIKGYSETNNLIDINYPLKGNVLHQALFIEWTSEINGMHWVELLSGTDRSLIARIKTEGRKAKIPKASLEDGKAYYIKILAQDSIHSEVKVFCENLANEQIENKLSSLVDYETANQLEKQWMRAVVLEMLDYPTEAGNIYQTILSSDQDDTLIKKLYTLFLVRNDQIKKANSLLN